MVADNGLHPPPRPVVEHIQRMNYHMRQMTKQIKKLKKRVKKLEKGD